MEWGQNLLPMLLCTRLQVLFYLFFLCIGIYIKMVIGGGDSIIRIIILTITEGVKRRRRPRGQV